jgi:Tol biopolymer transport system component
MADPGTGKPSGDATRVAGWKNFTAWTPQATADGKRLIAVKGHIDNGIYLGDLAFGNKGFSPHRFTPDDWYNVVDAWTHDSKAILFSTKRNGRWTILKQGIDAKTPETLIAGSENYFSAIQSSQGTVLYTATATPDWSRDTTARVMSTPEQGGARSTLVAGSHYYRCGSLPSSRCVVSEHKDRQLVFLDLDPVKGRGAELARIADAPGSRPAWDLSPDGARLVIVDTAQSNGEIQVLNLADRKVTVWPVRDRKWQFLRNINWAADGKSFFAHAQSASSIALVAIDPNGNPRVLCEFPVGAGWVDSIVPSPDGRSLAFTKRTFVNDVMLLENF